MAEKRTTHQKTRYIIKLFLWVTAGAIGLIGYIDITFYKLIPGGQWASNTTITEWTSHGDAMPLIIEFIVYGLGLILFIVLVVRGLIKKDYKKIGKNELKESIKEAMKEIEQEKLENKDEKGRDETSK